MHDIIKTTMSSSRLIVCGVCSVCVCVSILILTELLTPFSPVSHRWPIHIRILCTQFNFFSLIYCRKHMSYVCTRFSGTRYYQMKDVQALFDKQNKIAWEEKNREFFEKKITRTNQRRKSVFWKSNSLKWSIFDNTLLYFC